jgi:hypothetical protein
MYAKLLVEHNYKLFKVLIWPEQFEKYKEGIKNCEKSLIVFNAELKYDKRYTKANQFVFNDDSLLKVM